MPAAFAGFFKKGGATDQGQTKAKGKQTKEEESKSKKKSQGNWISLCCSKCQVHE